MMSLVNETINFQHIICKNAAIFLSKNLSSFCTAAKAPQNFSAKKIAAFDFVSTVRLNKS